MKRLLLVLGVLLVPVGVWAVHRTGTSYFHQLIYSETNKAVQMIRCDVSGSIPDYGTIAGRDYGWAGGGTCTSGDWTDPIDCTDMNNVSVMFFEYGAGSAVAKVWNCLQIPGPASITTSTAGFSIPGVEAPYNIPSGADPDPLCVSLDDSVGATLDGNNPGTQMMNISDQQLFFLVGEIDDCTGNCDSTLVISCGR
jgi:hypothetical protein